MSVTDIPPAAPPASASPQAPESAALAAENLRVWYGASLALRDITIAIPRNRITALIGPSGCGKSTLLRCFNRMNDLVPGARMEGTITFDGRDLAAPDVDPVALRRRIGMVFQKPNPFPKSIYQNVAWGARINGYRGDMVDLVERSLRRAALWDEVKDKLASSGLGLSGGQQQRLCVARGIAVEPEVLLLDEPASALDPVSTAKLEQTLVELKRDLTIVIVTHNLQQASRISDHTGFMFLGRMIEFGPTADIFSNPRSRRTRDYVTGRFG
jgi:phosphate transport system ATP-binding protein